MSERPRICLIYTGGTIGMVEGPRGLRPPENPQEFKEKMVPELKRFVEVDFVSILNKDSTNMHPGDWVLMANAVYDRLSHGYAGFVIAHGTDTMHFSSSALSFAFREGLKVPIVFTGAQTSPEVPHGDAKINLIRACKVATTDLAEVVISFGDYVFRGCRVQKKDERRFDAFESPGYFPIGYITEEILLHPTATTKDKVTEELLFQPVFESGVLQVLLIPGLEPELIFPAIEQDTCKGVILQSFGWGNVPNEGRFSFEGIIRKATEDHKPVIITSQFPAGGTFGSAYEPGRAAVAAGAIATGSMTSAASAAKFRWILATVNGEIRSGKYEESERVEQVRARMRRIYVRETSKSRTHRDGSKDP